MSDFSVVRHSFDPAKGFSDSVASTGPGQLLQLSGHVGFGTDGMVVVPGGVRAEAEAVFDQMARTLEAAGAGLEHLVRITAYLVDLDAYAEYSEVRRTRLVAAPPASTAVGVPRLLFGALIEVDGVAFIPQT